MEAAVRSSPRLRQSRGALLWTLPAIPLGIVAGHSPHAMGLLLDGSPVVAGLSSLWSG